MRHNLPTDAVTLNKIALLHPLVRTEALNIYQEATEALSSGRSTPRYTSTLRTFEEQTRLYAQGRTLPGKIVTNAKAGQSIHNYGFALDFALLVDTDNNMTFESIKWDMECDLDVDKKKDWMEVVSIFKKYGWEWGGDWKSFKDYPHFEKTFGHTHKTLFSLVQAGQVDHNGYVILKTAA